MNYTLLGKEKYHKEWNVCYMLTYHASNANTDTLRFLFYHLAAAVFYETHQPALLAAHMMAEL
jgi:hypothetical protein